MNVATCRLSILVSRGILLQRFDALRSGPPKTILTKSWLCSKRGLREYSESARSIELNQMFVWRAGWASTLRNEPFLTSLFEQLKALQRFRFAV